MLRLALVASLLLPTLAVASAEPEPDQPAPDAQPDDGPATRDGAPTDPPVDMPVDTPIAGPIAEPISEPAPPATAAAGSPAVRIVASGRVGGGLLLPGGSHVVTLLELVQIGWPARVEASDGTRTRARIVQVDRPLGLAVLELDAALPAPIAAPSRPARLDEVVRILGHGGTVGLGSDEGALRGQLAFSPLSARVAGVRPPDGDWAAFLIDRPGGDGDRGAPVIGEDGAFLGLLAEPVLGGGGRTRVVAAEEVLSVAVAAPLGRPWPRRSHFQGWAGIGIAAHNRPYHLAGSGLVGARVVLFDVLRLEPWFEADLGARGRTVGVGGRPTDLWWSLETGVSAGGRVPLLRVEGSRDYLVPTAGFRIGWNRFQHRPDTFVADCDDAGCTWARTAGWEQERSVRAGVEVGVDIRKGPVRVGYRIFIDPAAVTAHAMHRLFVTFDQVLAPLGVGDSN